MRCGELTTRRLSDPQPSLHRRGQPHGVVAAFVLMIGETSQGYSCLQKSGRDEMRRRFWRPGWQVCCLAEYNTDRDEVWGADGASPR